MPNHFNIPPLNSFRWTKTHIIQDARYNTIPFDDQLETYNPNGTYAAKWQTNDKAYIQLTSDFEPTLKFYKCDGEFYLDGVIAPVSTSLIGRTFLCYQSEIDFSVFDEGIYYAEITYTDTDLNVITYQSSYLDVAESWALIPRVYPGTMLIQYKSSYNQEGVIFNPTGLEFTFRVELVIKNFVPGSTDQLYTDQKHDVTQEDSVPFRTFTAFIGLAGGVPNWVIDKINRIFSVDQKRIDGVYYEKQEQDAKFTPFRPENDINDDAFWSLPVIPNENFFLDVYNVGGDNPNADYEVIIRDKEYLLNGINRAVAGIFTNRTTLLNIQINNRDLEVFTLLVGTSLGGAEIGTFETSGLINDVFVINKGFDTPTTVYLTGLAGHDTDVDIMYALLYDRSVAPTPGQGEYLPNTIYTYVENQDGEFEEHWDVATGLGNVGTQFEGCAMCDGRNAIDLQDMLITGWNTTQEAQRDTTKGTLNNLKTLSISEMPEHDHPTDMYSNKSRAGDSIGGQGPNNTGGSRTGKTGGGQSFDMTNYTRRMLYFVKLAS